LYSNNLYGILCILRTLSTHNRKDKMVMLTVEQLSQIINVPEHTIRRWLKDGVIEGKKFGHQWRISDKVMKEILEGGVNVTQS